MAVVYGQLQFREDVAAGEASSEVRVMRDWRPTVRLIGFAGAGRAVQYTTSPAEMIQAGTADWADWPDGVVVGDGIGRLTGAVTALRLSPAGGAGTWEVVS